MLMSAAGFYILCRGPSIEIYTSTHKNSPYYYCLVLATHLDNITLLLYTIDKNLDSPGGVIKELINMSKRLWTKTRQVGA